MLHKFKHRSMAAAAAVALSALAGTAQAAAVSSLNEGFDNVTTLAGTGWVQTNLSTPFVAPQTPTGWFQGDATNAFSAKSGVANSYVAANYNSAPAGGRISNWLITPELKTSGAGSSFSFWTRGDSFPGYGDHLKVLFNSTGSTNTADFTTVLADINASETVGGYPTADWVKYAFNLGASAGNGRVAFVYTQANGDNANYVGIDSVLFEAPEPGSLAAAVLALGLLGLSRRQRKG